MSLAGWLVVRCSDCVYWLRDDSLRARVCFFCSKIVTRSNAKTDHECEVYASHADVCKMLVTVSDRMHPDAVVRLRAAPWTQSRREP